MIRINASLFLKLSPSIMRVILIAMMPSIQLCHGLGSQTGASQHIEVPVGDRLFDPESHPTITMSLGKMRAVFTNNPPLLRLDKNGSKQEIVLPDELLQVMSARLYKEERMVIAGMMSGDAWMVAIVDLARGTVLDRFFCYSPSISPDGRYIAFIKFFPTHGISSKEDRYMIYDVALDPASNRPSGILTHPAVVGRVVYPSGATNLPSDNVDVGDRPVHEAAGGGPFWDENSTRYVFADKFQDQYFVVLVQVNGIKVSASPTVIPNQLICPPGSGSCSEYLTNVEFANSRSISLQFRGDLGTLRNPITVSLGEDASGAWAISPKK